MSLYPNNPEKQINAALRRLGHAQPPSGMEQRLRARLQDKAAQPKSHSAKLLDFFLGQRILFATAAAGLACIVIVIGSVQFSHQRSFPATTGIHLPAPGSGLGAASGARIAPQPIIAPEHGRARSEQKAASGRATISRSAHKPKGVAVPESTEPTKP